MEEQLTFKMEIAFDGTNYHGWQTQPNGLAVQQAIEERLGRLFGNIPIRIQGSSRTDSGVHALGMVASFRAPERRNIPDWKILKAMNRLLPDDIRIRSVEVVPPEFNARFAAKGKSYVYVINSGEVNPFTSRWSWRLFDFQNIAAVQTALDFLRGTHDFTSFAVESKKYDDPVRSIIRAEIYECGSLKCIHFIGDGFLYKMVRSMVGVLAEIGRNRLPPDKHKFHAHCTLAKLYGATFADVHKFMEYNCSVPKNFTSTTSRCFPATRARTATGRITASKPNTRCSDTGTDAFSL